MKEHWWNQHILSCQKLNYSSINSTRIKFQTKTNIFRHSLPSNGLQPSGDLLSHAICARFYPPLSSNHHKIICVDKFHRTTHRQTNYFEKTYSTKRKGIVRFASTTWGESLIKSMRNARALLYYVHMTTYNQINEKLLRVPIVGFYILIWFNIQFFCASLYVRVFDSGQAIKCARNLYKNNLSQTTQLHISTLHTPSYTYTYSYYLKYKDIFLPACCLRHKILYKTKISQYSQINARTLHKSSCASTNDNISAPDWVD